MMTIAILDYKAGNISSLMNALTGIDARVYLTDDPLEVLRAALLIMPGVGAFGDAVETLKAKSLYEAIKERHRLGMPILGICLGMQLLYEFSEELGHHNGLGLMRGCIKRIQPKDPQLKVPHMGWNTVMPQHENLPDYLLPSIEKDVYFVHSYCLFEAQPLEIMLYADYEMDIPAVVDNVFTRGSEGRLIGFQFHPEKSGDTGQTLLHAAIKEALSWN